MENYPSIFFYPILTCIMNVPIAYSWAEELVLASPRVETLVTPHGLRLVVCLTQGPFMLHRLFYSSQIFLKSKSTHNNLEL